MHPIASPSRRMNSRVEASGDVWVYWQCSGNEDLSPVLDISIGGLFIQTPKSKAENVPARLHFLVPEGQIRADAVVRHTRPGVGLGLKFTAISEQDRPQLAALLMRLRAKHHTPDKS
jgi:PilZ domain-containing protein